MSTETEREKMINQETYLGNGVWLGQKNEFFVLRTRNHLTNKISDEIFIPMKSMQGFKRALTKIKKLRNKYLDSFWVFVGHTRIIVGDRNV